MKSRVLGDYFNFSHNLINFNLLNYCGVQCNTLCYLFLDKADLLSFKTNYHLLQIYNLFWPLKLEIYEVLLWSRTT